MLTRQYLRSLEGSRYTLQLQNNLVATISAVLEVAGEERWETPQLCNVIGQTYGEKISSLVYASIALGKALGEDIIASDIQVYCPVFNTEFAQETMDDASAGGHPQTRAAPPLAHPEPVLCTTEIGLRRYARVVNVGSDDTKKNPIITMLKPRVLLTSFVDEMKGDGQT